ncbi:carbohydrate-binding domain-containing protein [Methanogenium organophilum]|uniref:Carbohydrate-binding domain-containing protein n=1 Tax=Methanogenium organophilum TaxID=2199 RepID=A0A9X9T847_METOG|nr:carbohydrate-binding domain-containing protein [Methanogenium organophilum]WAI01764.1 carbohydrate-binding domain-containing protein [Methanogenium organophilum]
MKKIIAILAGLMVAIALIVAVPAIFGNTNSDSVTTGVISDTASQSGVAYTPISVEYDADDLNAGTTGTGMSSIILEGNSITFDGSGATVDGTTVTITSAGMYNIYGSLNNGQIIVDTDDKETVRIVLNGADISCSTSAPIYVLNAEKTVITLADGTKNSVTDGSSYILEDAESDEPNAAIFSKDDLTINGGGTLTVTANYNNGIQSKDDLKITSGIITVTAVNDGIKGKDSVAIRDGTITIEAGGDGMQSTNDSDPEKGYIAIEGGTIDIVSGTDGIQAETSISISGGDITIASGGGSGTSSTSDAWGRWDMQTTAADSDTQDSAKGIKAGVAVIVTGGAITLDSSDDAIHSGDSITITGGTIEAASGDDGMHADSSLTINGGEITITKSYEGLESATITINDGTIHIVASDDGINVAGGNDGSSVNGRPGQNAFDTVGNYFLYINGGYTVINSGGDGLDSNGSIEMTRGVVIVNGPTNNGNGALDCNGAFAITGGYLVAVGSSGMAETPDTSSTLNSVKVTYASTQTAGTMVHIETEDGEDVLTVVPTKAYQSVVFCSAELQDGVTYVVYSGGSSTGTAADGLYSGGTYTPGTEITTFTVSGSVTYAGSSTTAGGAPGGVAPGDGGFPGDRQPR